MDGIVHLRRIDALMNNVPALRPVAACMRSTRWTPILCTLVNSSMAHPVVPYTPDILDETICFHNWGFRTPSVVLCLERKKQIINL